MFAVLLHTISRLLAKVNSTKTCIINPVVSAEVLLTLRELEQVIQAVDVLDCFYCYSYLSLSLFRFHCVPLLLEKNTVGLYLSSQHSIPE